MLLIDRLSWFVPYIIIMWFQVSGLFCFFVDTPRGTHIFLLAKYKPYQECRAPEGDRPTLICPLVELKAMQEPISSDPMLWISGVKSQSYILVGLNMGTYPKFRYGYII